MSGFYKKLKSSGSRIVLSSLALLMGITMFLSSLSALLIQRDIQILAGFWQILLLSSIMLLVVSFFSAVRSNPSSERISKELKNAALLTADILFLSFIFALLFTRSLLPGYLLKLQDLGASFRYELVLPVLILVAGILIIKDSFDLIYNFQQNGKEKLVIISIKLISMVALFILGAIFFVIFYHGVGAINWEFLTQPHRNLGQEGGIATCIEGTFWAVVIATLVSAPLGVGAGIYLHEYSKSGRLNRLITVAVSCLNGVPSVVYGLFGLALLVPIFGISLIVGSIILGLMNLPTIILTTEESLKSVPNSMREGSMALGASNWQTVQQIVLPLAMPGILTGLIISVARAAGETAPIMWIVAFTATPVEKIYGFVPDLTQPVNNLCFHLLQLIYFIGAWDVETRAWGTALVLLALILVMNMIAIIARNYYRKKFSW